MKVELSVWVAAVNQQGAPENELRSDLRTVKNNAGHELELSKMLKGLAAVINADLSRFGRDKDIRQDYLIQIRRVRTTEESDPKPQPASIIHGSEATTRT